MNVTLPNGKVIENVPEGTSKEEIKRKAIAAGFATEADFPQEQPQPSLSNLSGAFERTGQRLSALSGTPEERAAGVQPGIPKAVSELAVSTGDILASGVKDLIPEFTIDLAKEGIKAVAPVFEVVIEPAVRLGNLLSESPAASKAVEIARTGLDSYNAWKEESVENAAIGRELESLIDVSLLAAPATKVQPILPIDLGRSIAKKADDLGRSVARKGRQQSITARQNALGKVITPLSGFGEGKTSTGGIFGKAEYTLSPDEQETVRVLSKIKKLKPSDTMRNIYNVLVDDIASKGNRIKVGIIEAGDPEVDMDSLIRNIRQQYSDILNTEEFINIEGKQKRLEDTLAGFRRVVGDKPTASKVFEARKKLDQKLKTREYDADADIAEGYKAARRIISENIHNTLQETLSTGGIRATLKKQMPSIKHPEWTPKVKLKELLREQHLTYRALDEVDTKRQVEAPTAVGRTIQNLKRIGAPAPPVGMIGQAVAAKYAANTMASPAAGALFGTGIGLGALYGLGKTAVSGPTKKALGQLIRSTDNALRTVKMAPEMAAQLKLDRAYLASLLKEPEQVEQEAQEEEEQGGR